MAEGERGTFAEGALTTPVRNPRDPTLVQCPHCAGKAVVGLRDSRGYLIDLPDEDPCSVCQGWKWVREDGSPLSQADWERTMDLATIPDNPLLVSLDAPPSLVQVGPTPGVYRIEIPKAGRFVLHVQSPPEAPLATNTALYRDKTPLGDASIIDGPGAAQFQPSYAVGPVELQPGTYWAVVRVAQGFGAEQGQVAIGLAHESMLDDLTDHFRRIFGK